MNNQAKLFKIENYFEVSKTSYYALLKSSGKWKELFKEKEAMVSLILSVIATISLYLISAAKAAVPVKESENITAKANNNDMIFFNFLPLFLFFNLN